MFVVRCLLLRGSIVKSIGARDLSAVQRYSPLFRGSIIRDFAVVLGTENL